MLPRGCVLLCAHAATVVCVAVVSVCRPVAVLTSSSSSHSRSCACCFPAAASSLGLAWRGSCSARRELSFGGRLEDVRRSLFRATSSRSAYTFALLCSLLCSRGATAVHCFNGWLNHLHLHHISSLHTPITTLLQFLIFSFASFHRTDDSWRCSSHLQHRTTSSPPLTC